MTSDILKIFQKCNPKFNYDPKNNPKRYLTFPSEGIEISLHKKINKLKLGISNDNYDNKDNHYILCVNDKIISPEKEEYIILSSISKWSLNITQI